MTNQHDLAELEPLLDDAHMERLVQHAMVRVRARKTVPNGIGRLWPAALAAAAAGVLLAFATARDVAHQPRPPLDPVAAFGVELGVPRVLLSRVASGEAVTMGEAFVLWRPEAP